MSSDVIFGMLWQGLDWIAVNSFTCMPVCVSLGKQDSHYCMCLGLRSGARHDNVLMVCGNHLFCCAGGGRGGYGGGRGGGYGGGRGGSYGGGRGGGYGRCCPCLLAKSQQRFSQTSQSMHQVSLPRQLSTCVCLLHGMVNATKGSCYNIYYHTQQHTPKACS